VSIRGPYCFDCRHQGAGDICETVQLCGANEVYGNILKAYTTYLHLSLDRYVVVGFQHGVCIPRWSIHIISVLRFISMSPVTDCMLTWVKCKWQLNMMLTLSSVIKF